MKYISGPYTAGQLLRDVRAVEDWIGDEFARRGVIIDLGVQRDMARRLEEVSQGRNTVLFDDQGNPSIMVRVPAMLMSDLVAGWPELPHPAFVVGSKVLSELWIGKYQAFTVGADVEERALSLRRRDPRTYVNFGQALTACKQKGPGWHLMTNAEWAAIALWCKRNGYWPRGNNSYGKDYIRTTEKGELSYTYDSGSGVMSARVATGTGPAAWSHDGTPMGIWDLNGNICELVGGMRLVDGEIQILPDNAAADNTKDQSAASEEWRAILQDGTLVDPGTEGTLKYDSTGADTGVSQDVGDIRINTAVTNALPTSYAYNTFQTTAAGDATVPDLLKRLGLFPVDADHGGDGHYMRNVGERLPIRGGTWPNASSAGVFSLDLHRLRSNSSIYIGFRPAFAAI